MVVHAGGGCGHRELVAGKELTLVAQGAVALNHQLKSKTSCPILFDDPGGNA